MGYSPAEIAEINQAMAEFSSEVDGLVEAARSLRENNPGASREERLGSMARITIENLPDVPEVSQLVLWFVIAIDRLVN